MPGIGTALCTGSNVGETGVWRFNIRSGTVMCPDAGVACDTGLSGVCADGRTNCVGSGTECVQDVSESPERCDVLDNDCDGMLDESPETLCPEGQVCVSGSCLAPCFEFGCAAGQVCLPSGQCIDAACEDVVCPDGQRCDSGACVGACDGVVCPAGRSCRAGRCVDLCEGLACDDCTVCEEGVCVPRCTFVACPSGETCQDDGHCIETACVGVTCDPGSVCRARACVDACEDAVCPPGEACRDGACVPAPATDGGVPPGRDGGVASPDGGPAGGGDGGTGGLDGGSTGAPSDSGCGCRIAGARHASGLVPLGALAAILVLALYRRRG